MNNARALDDQLALPIGFYLQDVRQVARQLLGKRLVRQTDRGVVMGMIVETEAYAFDDPASHSFRGHTNRNAPMFGPPGRAYVYFSYGVHDMLNVVTSPEGIAEAVLLRAVFPLDGIKAMRINRANSDIPLHKIASGPGCVARAFGITHKDDNGIDLTSNKSAIWIGRGDTIQAEDIVQTTRIGITKAVELPWRYYIRGNPAVSRAVRKKNPVHP
jgi:DNA-3-methyladenine glycosylase